MDILVINAGSSSLKYQLINMKTEEVIAKGQCERIGLSGSCLSHKKTGSDEVVIKADMQNHTVAIKYVLDALVNKDYGVLKSMDDISAVGHRVVHSAEDFKGSVKINDEVMKICKKNADLAPLHVPANIMGIEACQAVMKNTPMVAVFDTAFHSGMPDYAFMYAIPYEAYTDWKIRRYGFHGTSHKFVSDEAAKYLNKDIKNLKIVTCHLGNGSSIAAVDKGVSVDTSMGFTPLEGVPMGTRSGDIDPAVIEYLMQKGNMDIKEIVNYLNKKSGVLGISGLSSDFRDLCAGADSGNKRAKLALDVFCYRVKKYIGAYIAAMNGADCIVFTAGIGENTVAVRSQVTSNLSFLGIEIDEELNSQKNNGKIRDISKAGSKVKVLIVPTNEELVIARETLRLI